MYFAPLDSLRSWLQDRGPSNTFWRLWTSRHLRDLQVVLVVALMLLVVSTLIFIGVLHFHLGGMSFDADVSSDVWHAIAGAVIAGALAALNWAYQTGSRRLGAVDLFGCEIGAICRVSLIVDFARNSIGLHESGDLHKSGDADWTAKFTSKEEYTPVFDKTLSDLQALSVETVSYVTEFYTYRMTMMDFLRRIAVTKESAAKSNYLEQMIYMQFLMYESARHAVTELVEFQPNRAESRVNILCSELFLYKFLLEIHSNDYRTDRLCLRIPHYGEIIPELLEKLIDHQKARHWEKAYAVGNLLVTAYNNLRSGLPPGWTLPELTERQRSFGGHEQSYELAG